MERELGFFEEYCRLLDQDFRNTAIVLTTGTVRGPLNPLLVSKVLVALQKRHPLLRAQILEGERNKSIFDTSHFDQRSEAQHLQEVPLIVLPRQEAGPWQKKAVTLTNEPFNGYLWRVLLFLGDDEHEIVLHSAHIICDALSTTTLMRDIVFGCSKLANHQATSWNPLPMVAGIEANLIRNLEPLADHVPGIEERSHWPYQEFAELDQRRELMLFRQLDRKAMTRLKSACQKQGLTVNGALGAAHLMCQYEYLRDGESEKPYMFSSAVNLRNSCDPKVSDEIYGTYVCCVNTYHQLTPRLPFWELARAYSQALTEGIKVMGSHGFLPATYERKKLHDEVKSEIKRGKTSICFPEGPLLSNLGLLKFETSYPPFELMDIYFGTRQVAADCGTVLSAVTFNGKLSLCFSVPHPIIHEETAEKIVAKFMQLIDQASG